uniref:Titin n=1 Tax=Dicentrarchus labrax TaxID=13489 RepID=A0A8C4F8N5_DICLA
MEVKNSLTHTTLTVRDCTRVDGGHFLLSLSNIGGTTSIPVNVKVLDRPGPLDGPLKVKIVSAEKCNLHWNPPLNDGGASVSHFVIEKRETSRVTWTAVEPHVEAVSYKVTKLVPGKEYIFRIAAVNKFVKVSEAPLPPGKITFSDATCNSGRLSWEKPDHDGGSKITRYIVEMQAKGDDTWTICSETRALEVTINGLARGKEYFFRVSAVNEKGKSEPKTLLAPVTINDTSAEPVMNLLSNTFSVKAGNDLKIDVPFKGVPQPTVAWKKEGNLLKETSRVNVYTSDTSSQMIIKDATRIDAGMYEVTLANSVGSASAEIFVNVFERPGPPCDLSLDEVSADFMSLSWQPPHYTGGCQISNYVVEKRDTGSTIWQTVSATVARTSIKISRLTQGNEYQFRIALFSAPSETTGPVTVQHDVEPPKITVEDKFRQVVVVKAGDLLRIDADISGRPNPTVFWLKNGRNIGTKGRVEITATKTHTSLLIRESVRKDSGQYTLTLQNTGGTISKAITCKVLDRPGPPAGPLEVSGLSAEKCTLSWGPPHETGGAEIMYYIVEKCETSRVAWILVYGDMMATTCKITKLLKGNEYLFRVKAVNKYGEGETLESEPIKAVDPFTIPSAPTDVEVTSATRDTMTISWKRPDTDGGSRISGYIIEKREKQGVRWVRVNKKPVYDLRVKASCLHEGCEYEFRVFAENAGGLSEPSLPCSLTLAEDPKFLPSPPAKPTIIDSSKSSITLSIARLLWSAEVIISRSSCQEPLFLIFISCCAEK